MTLEERKERFFNFHGCTATVCDDCVYHGVRGLCADRITEDARAILKDMAENEDIKEFEATIRPIKYETPLTGKDREQIKELIRVKTEVPDISAHFIQEINELCASLNSLASLVSKLEQLRKGTDPIGYVDDVEREKTELVVCIGTEVDFVFGEAADVINYLCATGLIDNDYHVKIEGFRNEKLARWANRLNGVIDE